MLADWLDLVDSEVVESVWPTYLGRHLLSLQSPIQFRIHCPIPCHIPWAPSLLLYVSSTFIKHSSLFFVCPPNLTFVSSQPLKRKLAQFPYQLVCLSQSRYVSTIFLLLDSVSARTMKLSCLLFFVPLLAGRVVSVPSDFALDDKVVRDLTVVENGPIERDIQALNDEVCVGVTTSRRLC